MLFNWTACFKKCKQLFEYQHLLLLRDIWWSKFLSIFKCCTFFQHHLLIRHLCFSALVSKTCCSIPMYTNFNVKYNILKSYLYLFSFWLNSRVFLRLVRTKYQLHIHLSAEEVSVQVCHNAMAEVDNNRALIVGDAWRF